MEILLICRYCDYKWTQNVYAGRSNEEKCWKCGDTNIDVKDISKTKIDGYLNCPSFPDREAKEESGNTDFPFHYGSD